MGKTVTASGATTDLVNGSASWIYRLDNPAENTTVTIKDANGNTVYRETLSMKAGTDRIVWDGTTNTGQKVTSGRFTVTIDARNSNGQYIPVTTEMMGVVDGVDVSGTEPYLLIGDLRIPLSSITAVHGDMPPPAEDETPDPDAEAA